MTTAFHVWALNTLIAIAPPEQYARAHDQFGIVETAEQRIERYERIVDDLEHVVFAADFKPLLSDNKSARVKSALLALAVAWHESGFAPDVDLGPCYRVGPKWTARCDSGHAACILQVHVLYTGTTSQGWTLEEVQADRRKCFTSGLSAMRGSIGLCWGRNGRDASLAAYASGRCEEEFGGWKGSAELWHYYDRASKAGGKIPTDDAARAEVLASGDGSKS